MTYLQALIIGAFQGITELFPVSSLGHSVILPGLFRWSINQHDPIFLTFLVATHAATALVLFFYFFKDWRRIISGMARSLKERDIRAGGTHGMLGWLLAVATIPAGICGLLFQDFFQGLFASPRLVAGVLILNGVMLLGADALRKRRSAEKGKRETVVDEHIAKITWWQALKIGLLQLVSLIPGFSRTGSTITGGLAIGLSYEDAARFSFLLATPIIGAASLLKLPELFTAHGEAMFLGQTLLGAIVAALFAYFSTRFLLKYFETEKLWPFAIYCIAVGVLASIFFL